MPVSKQKITLEVPRDLLKRAQRVTGTGITETVRAGLERVAASEAYQRLLGSQGNVHVAVTWQQLKDDR